MIIIDESSASAEVYKLTDKDVYLIKVHLSDVGLHIQGIRAQKSKFPNQPLWIQMPGRPLKTGGWVTSIEFSNDSPLKKLLESLVTQVVNDYSSSSNDSPDRPTADIVVEPTDWELEHMGEVVGEAVDDFLKEKPP